MAALYSSLCAALTLSLLCIFQIATGHSNGHPIHKKIKGTFVYYDATGAESMTLYVCNTGKNNFHWSIMKTITAENYGNFLMGTGNFARADIDYHADTVTNQQCFFQAHNEYGEATSCVFDVTDLCDQKKMSLSLTMNTETFTFEFVKTSIKGELIGNDKYAPYQCGVPYGGDLSQEDVYPLGFVSDPLPWSPDEGLRQAEVYTSDESGCWGYVLPDGTSAFYGFGEFSNRDLRYNKAVYLQRWNDELVPEGAPCQFGAQINIRVDRDVMIMGWHCSDGVETYGDGMVLFKSSEFSSCPIG